MILAMCISLYTSRIVLAELGITDFGIYNVVGGVVTVFSVLNSAMAGSTQRYLTFELGTRNNQRLNLVFNTSLQIHCVIAISVALVTEIIGLWFIDTKMTIPLDKMTAAHWVFQFSILSMVVSFLNVPYIALIIAYEKMGAFAYISILEVLLKFGSALLLIVSPIDKLKFYAVLMFLCPLIVRIFYWHYCKKYFEASRLKRVFDKGLFKEMTSFAGWGLIGQLAAMGSTQGVNILLNLFWGPVVNAARGVAVQAQSAVTQLSTNFQTAMNPQITKNYANNDLVEMHELMCRSAKFSFLLLFALGLPVMIEAPFILSIWLEDVPENSALFLRIILWISIVDAMANPLMVAAMASGKIVRYQTIIGTLQLLIIPVSYFVLKLGMPAYSVFLVNLIICIIAFISRLYLVSPLTYISPMRFFDKVIVRCFWVSIISVIIPIVLYLNLNNSPINSVFIILIAFMSVISSSALFGLTQSERTYIYKICKRVLLRLKL